MEPPGSVPGTRSSHPAEATARAADGKPCGDAAVAAGERPRGVSPAPRREQLPGSRSHCELSPSLCRSSLLCTDTKFPGAQGNLQRLRSWLSISQTPSHTARRGPGSLWERDGGFRTRLGQAEQQEAAGAAPGPCSGSAGWWCSLKAVSMPKALYENPSSPSAGHEEATVLMDHATEHTLQTHKEKGGSQNRSFQGSASPWSHPR